MSEKRGYYVNTGLRAEAQKWRLKFQEEERQKQKEQEEIDRKRRAEEELKKLREEVRRKQEIEDKTKRYFEFNKYNRKIPSEGNPYYFGDMTIINKSWMPHGTGQFFVNEISVLEGKYNIGEFYEGKVVWTDGTGWDGSLKNGVMHGVGNVVKEGGERKPALAWEGKLICIQEGIYLADICDF